MRSIGAFAEAATPAATTAGRGRGRRLPVAILTGCALLAGATAVSGCGASATLDPVAQAAEVTSHQVGARISFDEQLSAPQLPSPVQITATGYIAWRQRAETLNMSFSGVPGLSASGAGSSEAQMVFMYPTLYMRIPALAEHLPEGKSWMQIDIQKAAQAAGIGSSELSSPSQWDPSQFLNYLRASSGSIVPVDKETLDGVLTTHYRVNLEVSRIVEHVPGEQQAAAKAALEKLGISGELPVEVWIDGQGRVRREMLSFSGGAIGLTGAITVDFASFGPVPPVTAPPANAVFDATGAG
jgi:hypothetical protein